MSEAIDRARWRIKAPKTQEKEEEREEEQRKTTKTGKTDKDKGPPPPPPRRRWPSARRHGAPTNISPTMAEPQRSEKSSRRREGKHNDVLEPFGDSIMSKRE